MNPLSALLPKIRKISMSLYLELVNGTLYGKDSLSVVKDLEMGQLCWTTRVLNAITIVFIRERQRKI